MSSVSVPSWARAWYIANLFILIPDWLFVMLRPRSLTGGDLAHIFSLFNVYARVDTLFAKTDDAALGCIYILSFFDILFVLYICLNFKSSSHHIRFVLLCFCREMFVFTNTLLYLMYSWPFIIPSWQIPVTMLNSQWCIIPIAIVTQLCSRIIVALEKSA